jgi:hypothetical protein
MLTSILILLSRSISATGPNTPGIIKSSYNHGTSSILREIANYLEPVDTQALAASHRGLNAWTRKLILKKVTSSTHTLLDRDSSWKLLSSLRAEVEEYFLKLNTSIYPITRLSVRMIFLCLESQKSSGLSVT